jgi:hypothetical protein
VVRGLISVIPSSLASSIWSLIPSRIFCSENKKYRTGIASISVAMNTWTILKLSKFRSEKLRVNEERGGVWQTLLAGDWGLFPCHILLKVKWTAEADEEDLIIPACQREYWCLPEYKNMTDDVNECEKIADFTRYS